MTTVTLSKTRYLDLKRRAAKYEAVLGVPEYYVKGRAGIRLDRRVTQALREYQAGKTVRIKSLADLD